MPENRGMVTRAAVGKEVWKPHAYQTRAVSWLASRNTAALFLDPGLGKTSSTLAAFVLLQEKQMARKMLVVAPKRVCYLVWRQEGERWAQFNHLKFSLLHGRKKEEALKDDADVYLINPEGIPWLMKQFKSTVEFANMFDTVVIDELTKFKNHRSKRWKAFYPYASRCTRRWGLTGTPAPNGLMDLFGQVKLLDDGNALGKYYTRFRDMYFVAGYDGYTFKPRGDADERIQARLKDFALRMKAEDYLELPEFVDDIRRIDLDDKARKVYDQMKKEMVADLPDGTISADNVAGVYSKLKQMAGGAVYRLDKNGERVWEHVHDAKLDALEELVEELAGQPVLVAYEFNHELERILERFGDIPYLGKGTTDAQAVEIERRWNENKIPVLPVHPASSGHGLNLQKGSAAHICWFNPTWDFELYDQLVRRLYRQGSQAKTIFNHILAVDKSIDYLVLEAIKEKDTTQARLVQGLGEVLGAKTQSTEEEKEMVEKLKPSGWGAKKATGDTPPPPAETPKGWGAPKAKNGWGAPKAEEQAVPAEEKVDTTAMEEKLTQAKKAPETPAPTPKPAPRKRAPAAEADKPLKTTSGMAGGDVSVSFRNPNGNFTLYGTDQKDILDKFNEIVNILS